MYLTRYSIFDKNTEKPIFQNRNSACFAEFTSSNFKFGYASNRKLEVYLPIKPNNNELQYYHHSNISNKLAKWWTEELTYSGFPVEYSTRQLSRISSHSEPCVEIANNLYHVFTLDFDKYDSNLRVKLALHLLRHIYESDQPRILEAAYEYQQKYPRAKGLNLFNLTGLFLSSGGGHVWNYGGGNKSGHFLRYLTKKEVDEYIKKSREEPLDLQKSYFVSYCKIAKDKLDNKGCLSIGDTNIKSNIKWQEYINISRKLFKKNGEFKLK